MKIHQSLRHTYKEYFPQFEILKKEVDSHFNKIIYEQREKKEQKWFFVSRLKTEESFALKVETGRVKIPSKMEDFFACTVVVPTLKQIDEVEQIILNSFKWHERRPKNKTKTHKQSSNFVFDDLRIYASLHPHPGGKYPFLDGVIFEIQIKTILQYAWSDSTHDLIYKADEINWPRERIAFQVKAMLEHADLVIMEAAELEKSFTIAKQDNYTTNIKNLIDQIKKIWHPQKLPNDIRRLAEIIQKILQIAGFTAADFAHIIATERRRCYIQEPPQDLSPYAFTVQALANFPDANLQAGLNQEDGNTYIVIHKNMDLPKWMTVPHKRIILIE